MNISHIDYRKLRNTKNEIKITSLITSRYKYLIDI